MTEELKHDPKAKKKIKDVLYDLLYSPIKELLRQRLHGIIKRNTAIGKYTHYSFTYKNEFYSCDALPKPRKSNFLVPQLRQEMDEYLELVEDINRNEIPYVLGYINQVLNSTDEFHDYLKLLPEQVHQPIQDLINTCPCHNDKLSDQAIEAIRARNSNAITLMKHRIVKNLIL